MDGFVSCPVVGVERVSKIGSVQYAKALAGSVVPSGLKVRKALFIPPIPCRSPYSPVRLVRMSMAVCAMSGVWLFDRNVPLFSKKFSRFGIISRSDGSFGLSRKKCVLSKVIWMTCLIPLPSWQVLPDIARKAG